MTKDLKNADEDPDYIGHITIEGPDYWYSYPRYSDDKKNFNPDIKDGCKIFFTPKKDMVEGEQPKEKTELSTQKTIQGARLSRLTQLEQHIKDLTKDKK